MLNIHGGDDKAEKYTMLNKKGVWKDGADGGGEDGLGEGLEGKTRKRNKDAGVEYHGDTADEKDGCEIS